MNPTFKLKSVMETKSILLESYQTINFTTLKSILAAPNMKPNGLRNVTVFFILVQM